MSNNLLNLLWIWPLRLHPPTLKKECVLGLIEINIRLFSLSLKLFIFPFQIHIPLPAKIDPSVTMMTVEEKPDVTYADVGGCKEQIEKLREVVEMPLLHVIFLIKKFSKF